MSVELERLIAVWPLRAYTARKLSLFIETLVTRFAEPQWARGSRM
ncbi:MAG: hypothetical protein NW215_07165 [Hyphomicrobiales bacterium]|nr:hypothetical protein [Hyphomicrobiales bacterium]